ncbi:MAG TPA: hypothetical protein VKT18_02620, partial [Acidimicrobiales bacterium]|nr:hypothetical protein [Acidimicrobiales bacterium]
TPLDASGAPLNAVSCTATGLCAAVDNRGRVFTSDNATGGPPAWTASSIDGTHALAAVACAADGLCLAVDQNGAAIAGLEPAPVATTGTAAASSQTVATLTATVDPGDASLSSCQFNYGTSTAYGTSVPCSAIPAGGGGTQAVSAQITGLTAATTYHFQITASSGVATGTGADGTFTTPAAIKASPSLSGTPAVGGTLTCKPNVTVPAGVTVAYGWTRDTVAIAGAAASTYAIAAADAGHHLACVVTISGDGGSTTATSGFTAVPAQSGATITESFVGTAKDSANAAKAPVSCSPQAAGRCTFTLTLTTKRSGKQIVIGKSTSSVATGAKATLSVRLDAAGTRLLAQKRRLAVTLTVKGTVIGTLVGTLQTDHFTFKAKGAASHATRHRR